MPRLARQVSGAGPALETRLSGEPITRIQPPTAEQSFAGELGNAAGWPHGSLFEIVSETLEFFVPIFLALIEQEPNSVAVRQAAAYARDMRETSTKGGAVLPWSVRFSPSDQLFV